MSECHVHSSPPPGFTRVLSMLPVLRPATGPLCRAAGIKNRTFVSTVLLSKSWDSETVADLRKELKKRGLTSWVIKLLSCRHNHSNEDTGRATKLPSSLVFLNTTSVSSVMPWPLHLYKSGGPRSLPSPRRCLASQTLLPLHPTLAPATFQYSCQTLLRNQKSRALQSCVRSRPSTRVPATDPILAFRT